MLLFVLRYFIGCKSSIKFYEMVLYWGVLVIGNEIFFIYVCNIFGVIILYLRKI